jgi:CheY-specific phosphatase CheX
MENEKAREFALIFSNSLREITEEMSGVVLHACDSSEIVSSRIHSIIINIVGVYKGRALLKMGVDIVNKITESMNFGPLDTITDTSLYLGEFSNIVCGRAITNINNRYKSCDLRLTPPAIFSGQQMRIITPDVHSMSLFFSSDFGPIALDIGFEAN